AMRPPAAPPVRARPVAKPSSPAAPPRAVEAVTPPPAAKPVIPLVVPPVDVSAPEAEPVANGL
ncbi:MAG: hypothetical protein JWN59_148, partial [Sphingomonas bacterium]|nr:hypothetical protein [Sphingomonas bacterium]